MYETAFCQHGETDSSFVEKEVKTKGIQYNLLIFLATAPLNLILIYMSKPYQWKMKQIIGQFSCLFEKMINDN